jgi:hypothetical protein
MVGIERYSAAPQMTTWPSSASPDPIPIVPTPISASNFRQFPTMGPDSRNDRGASEADSRGPTANQGAVIALGVICALLILGNLFVVLLYCIGQSYMDENGLGDAMTTVGPRPRRRKRRKARQAYSNSSMMGNDGDTEKNSDLESLIGPKDAAFRRGPAFFRPQPGNFHPVPPAYFAGQHHRNSGRVQMPQQTQEDPSVDEPSDASVAGSSKYDEVHQMHGGRSSGSPHSSKSSKTETQGRRPKA